MSVQLETLRHKALAMANAAIEQFGDNDEALDTYQRAADIDSYGDITWCAPAWLDVYSSTGTGTEWQDAIIARHEQAQADEWSRQFPDRASLFDIAAQEESQFQSEAHDWLDGALNEECIYLSFEIRITDDEIIIRSGFGDEINTPLAAQFRRAMSHDGFLTASDSDIAAIIDEIENTVYTRA